MKMRFGENPTKIHFLKMSPKRIHQALKAGNVGLGCYSSSLHSCALGETAQTLGSGARCMEGTDGY